MLIDIIWFLKFLMSIISLMKQDKREKTYFLHINILKFKKMIEMIQCTYVLVHSYVRTHVRTNGNVGTYGMLRYNNFFKKIHMMIYVRTYYGFIVSFCFCVLLVVFLWLVSITLSSNIPDTFSLHHPSHCVPIPLPGTAHVRT